MPIEHMFVVIGVLLLVSIYASKVSSKFGIPTLVLFLIIGMLAGSEGIGGIDFDNPALAKAIGDIALTLILFAGGLDTQWKQIRPVLGIGLMLSTVGVGLTMVLLGTFTWFMLGDFSSFNIGAEGLTWPEGLLLGAIVSSTDAAAVFSIFRSSNLNLQGDLQPLLELESGSNDPMAVLLTTSLLGVLTGTNTSFLAIGINLVQQLLLGSLLGYGAGRGMAWLINRIRFDAEGLYPLATLAQVFLTFGVTTFSGGNGFLAVYIAGVVLRSCRFANQEQVISFHDSLSWLMQIAMFLTLGLLVFPSQLLPIAGVALITALFLIFIARPISVMTCLSLTTMSLKEKLFISWVGLRGSVPIILATFPLVAGIEGAEQIFNIVFFIVLVSVLTQGFSLVFIARWLQLAEAAPMKQN